MRDFMKRKRRTLLFLLLFAALFLFAGVFSVLGEPKAVDASVQTTLDTLPASLNDLFTDYTQTKLNEAYDTMEELDALKEKVKGNKVFFDRAEEVIKGKVAYEPDREFSTKANAENKIEQSGDKSAYSRSNLKLFYTTSDLMITGIYGMTNDKISVYVEADRGARLPSLVITQNKGYYTTYREQVYLNRGKNTFTYSDLASRSSQSRNEIKGGAIYIVNPYTPSTQGGQVSLYIEGGGFYPVFRNGDDEQQFLDMLEEYETMRMKHSSTMLDMAELETDHVMFTLGSSTLYNEYIRKKSITPSENLELWAEYFKKTFDFNGIATSPDSACGHYDQRNDSVKINLRLMSAVANSGAYATSNHIGFYDQSEWFANFNFVDHSPSKKYIYDIGHEVGHVLDVQGRILPETTNNVNATHAYIDILGLGTSIFYPSDKAFNSLKSDYGLQKNAFEDGRVIYQSDSNYDHNHLVWWYLESVFPGYWGRMNNYFRYEDTLYGANDVEKMVYYSSLATKVDLSEYFDRWGVYLSNKRKFSIDSASSAFQTAMETARKEGKISEKAGHYWYVDSSEYDFMRKHKDDPDKSYKGGDPVITSITESNGTHEITIGGRSDANLLGYEILSKTDGGEFKIAGFTYVSYFLDEHVYSSTPTYKVVAINRFFSTKESEETSKAEGGSSQVSGVCKVGDQTYPTLGDAIGSIGSGSTNRVVELLSDCSIGDKQSSQVTIKVADEVKRDITITCTGQSYMFHVQSQFKLEGRENARIILTGGASVTTYPMIYAASGTFSAEYVNFSACKSKMNGGAIYSLYADVELKDCSFENCSSGGNSDAIFMTSKPLKLENCTFTGQNVDVYFNQAPDLTLVKSVPKMTIGRKESSTVKIKTEGFEPSEEDRKNLSFADPTISAKLKDGNIEIGGIEYELTFKSGSNSVHFKVKSSRYIFGSEELSFVGEDQYCSSYQANGNTYKPGETIELSGDMTFEVTLSNKNKLTLNFMDHKQQEIDFIGEKGVYLPRFDGDKKIVLWVSDTGSYYAGEMFHASKDESLTAVYLDCFLYRYMDKGKCEEYGYEEYGSLITVKTNNNTDFRGWFTDGKIVKDTITITKNTLLTAIYNSDKFDLSEAKITVPDCVYTGEPQRPQIVVELNGLLLSDDFYKVEYSDNVNAGTAKVKITARGDIAENSKEQNFEIQKALPFTRPSENIRVGSSTETVKGVSLPEGWSWKDPDRKLEMGENKATAVYFDKENFSETEMEIVIMREEGAGGGSGSEQTPQNPQTPQEPDEGEDPEPELPENPQEGEEPDDPEDPEDPKDPEKPEEPKPDEPDQEPDDGEDSKGEQNPGDSANSGSNPGDSADTGNHAGGADSGTVEKGGNSSLLWLLVIPGVLIPAGVVLFILLKKRKNG